MIYLIYPEYRDTEFLSSAKKVTYVFSLIFPTFRSLGSLLINEIITFVKYKVIRKKNSAANDSSHYQQGPNPTY